MNALLLPGNSPRHEKWIEDLKDFLAPYFDTVVTQHYRHWKTAEEFADIEYEVAVANEKSKHLSPYVIIGKSIGTIITAKAAADGMIHPEKIILLGVPMSYNNQFNQFAQHLEQITIPITIIQNSADPFGSFLDLKNALTNARDNVSFIELEGETHDYNDFASIKKLI